MAEVFKAKSYGVEGFEKIIAIKRILPSMGEDREFIKMFIDEAKIAGQLAHANICQIFELGRIEGAHFIAMEFIWGKDLLQIQNRLRKLRRPMPVDMACFMLAKVCEGLDYAHRKRDAMGRPLEIVHRDCSPQNVLVSYEGEVKVIDFGIAKAAMRNSRTMAGVLKGKFGYMSPEQVRGLPLDRRSDIFALGTMLYECLTSDRLFQGETDFSTLEKVRNVDIQAPRAINPEIPEEVERIILKALAKDTEDRYQWCSDMLADLQQHLMRQEVVFTAKTLAGWLKDVFNSDVERERASLEAYKRIGRDGLIAGVPAASAKLDVVEHLGEAGQSEDPTMLGAPGFEDVERSQGFETVEVGPASGSPAAMGSGKPPKNEFGEEAPTEIFGEISDADAEDAPMRKPLPTGRPTVPNQSAAAPGRPGGLGSATVPMGSAQAPRPGGMMPQFGAPRAATNGEGGEPSRRPGSQSGPLPGVTPAASGAPNAPAGGGLSGGIPRAPGLSGPAGGPPLPPMTSGPNAATIAPGQMMAPPQLAAINAANAAAAAANGANGGGAGGPGIGQSGPAANGGGPPVNGGGPPVNGGPGIGQSGPGAAANGAGLSGPTPMPPMGVGGAAPGLPGVGAPPPMNGGPGLPGVAPAPGFGPGPNAPGLGTGLNNMGGSGPSNLPGVPSRPLPGMPNPPGMGPGGPGFPVGGSGPMPGWQPAGGQAPAQTLLGMQPPPGGPQGPGGYPMMPGMGPGGPGGPGMGPGGPGMGPGGPGMGPGGPGMGPGGPGMGPGGPQGMGGPLSAGLGRPYGVSPYGVGQGQGPGGPAPAVPVPAEGKRQAKKSSVVRDIAIGVSIAAFVLAAFVVIKLTVLDEDEPSPMATMRVLLTNGTSGTLAVDDKTIGPINSMFELPETAGNHQVKVTAADGSVICDQAVALAAGEIKSVDCAAKVEAPVADAGAVAASADAAAMATEPDAGVDAAAVAGDPKLADAGAVTAAAPDAKSDEDTDGKPDGKTDGKPDPKVADNKPDPKVTKPDPKVTKPDPKAGTVKRPPIKDVKKKDPPKGGGLKDL